MREHSNIRMFYTAMDGTLVLIGLLQSIPSSSMESCARLKATAPFSAWGQMKRPRFPYGYRKQG